MDRAVAQTHLLPILTALAEAGCEIRGDSEVTQVFPAANPATESGLVDGIISTPSSRCALSTASTARSTISAATPPAITEAIVAEDAAVVARFFHEVDSAILLQQCLDAVRRWRRNSAWVPRSASRQAECTRAVPSAWNS